MVNVYPNIIKEIITLPNLEEAYCDTMRAALPEEYESF